MLLLILAAGFGIAWATERYRHWNEPLTFQEAVDMMRERGRSELVIQQVLEPDGLWYRYTLRRELEPDDKS